MRLVRSAESLSMRSEQTAFTVARDAASARAGGALVRSCYWLAPLLMLALPLMLVLRLCLRLLLAPILTHP